MNTAELQPAARSLQGWRQHAGATLCAACVLFSAPQSGQSGDLLLPLGAGATRQSAEAYARSVAEDNEPLGRSSAKTGDAWEAKVRFSVGESGVSVVAFSDDGIDVYVTDLTLDAPAVKALDEKGNGQALPNLDQSLRDLDYTFEANHSYELTVDYLNTLYTGEGDIDGAQLIAYGGTIYSCGVSINGNERDRIGCIGRPEIKVLSAVPAYSRAAAGCPDKQETYFWEIFAVKKKLTDGWRPLPIGDEGPFELLSNNGSTVHLRMLSSEGGSWEAQLRLSYERTGPNCGLNKCAVTAFETMTFTAVEIERIAAMRPPPLDGIFSMSPPVSLEARRNPAPADGPWPDGQPVWSSENKDSKGENAHNVPSEFSLATLTGSPATNFGTAGIIPGIFEEDPDVEVQGTIPYVVTCTCGSSSKSLAITIQNYYGCGIREIKPVGAIGGMYKVVQGDNIVGPRIEGGLLTLKLVVNSSLDPTDIKWGGDATKDQNDPTQATVPIGVSEKKTATVNIAQRFNGQIVKDDKGEPVYNTCESVTIWPVWATLEFKGDNAEGDRFQCGPAQRTSEAVPGLLPPGDPRLGQPRVRGGWIQNQYSITATITPGGVGKLNGVQFDFKNSFTTEGYYKDPGGAYQGTRVLTGGRLPNLVFDDDEDNSDEGLDASDNTVCLIDALTFSELAVTGLNLDGTLTYPELQFAVELLRKDAFRCKLHLVLNRSNNSFDAANGVPVSSEIFYTSSIHAKVDPATRELTRGNPSENYVR